MKWEREVSAPSLKVSARSVAEEEGGGVKLAAEHGKWIVPWILAEKRL